MKKAYDNWTQVIEYDSKSFLGFDQNKSPDAQNDHRIQSQYQPNSFDHLTLPTLPASDHVEHSPVTPGLAVRGNQKHGLMHFRDNYFESGPIFPWKVAYIFSCDVLGISSLFN